MAITKIQSGAIPADAIDTTQISDLSVTHAKLHTDMDLSSKTVTLPSAITNTITNKLPLAGGTMTGELIIADTGTLDIRMGTDKRVTWSGALGEIGSVAGFQATNTAGSALSSFGMRGSDLRFATGSEERMRIKDTGVGIGNIAPSSALTIGKRVNTYEDVIAITNFNNDVDVMAAIGFDQSNDTLTIRNDQGFATGGIGFRAGGTTDHLFIKTGGNVGIGTNNPLAKLHVSGNVSVSGLSSSGVTTVANPTGSSYNENLRLPAANNGFVSIGMGTNPAADSGVNTNQWTIVKYPSNHGTTPDAFGIRIGDYASAQDDVIYARTNKTVAFPSMPYAYYYHSGVAADITSGLTGDLVYDAKIHDSTNSFNGTRFTAPATGLYEVEAKMWFESGTAGTIYCYLNRNGGIYQEQRMTRTTSPGEYYTFVPRFIVPMTSGDYFQLQGEASGGGELHRSSGVRYTHLTIKMLPTGYGG